MMGMQLSYPAIFDDSENEKGIYTVTFPDVPCAITEGKGIKEAEYNAKAALALGLHGMEKYPESSAIGVVKTNNPSKIVKLIEIDPKKINEGVVEIASRY